LFFDPVTICKPVSTSFFVKLYGINKIDLFKIAKNSSFRNSEMFREGGAIKGYRPLAIMV
jgi:hypothetical protein